jgi:hypothetical protein
MLPAELVTLLNCGCNYSLPSTSYLDVFWGILASIENNFFYISTSRMVALNEKADKETEKCQVAEFADWILNT